MSCLLRLKCATNREKTTRSRQCIYVAWNNINATYTCTATHMRIISMILNLTMISQNEKPQLNELCATRLKVREIGGDACTCEHANVCTYCYKAITA